jgi:dienelactone hydrolase
MDMTGAAPEVRRWLPVRLLEVATEDVTITTRHGQMAARVYRGGAAAGPSVVIFPGVHAGGVDEPRLASLSRRIAAAGATVLSAPLPDLRRYRISPDSTDDIEDIVSWMTSNAALAPQGRVGIVGVSFAGGLALVAAGRPSISGRITGVFALGAHADLPRVIRYLCLAEGAPKTLAPPHDYGVVLMLRTSLALVVPADQVAALDRAVVTFLDASSAESTDRTLSARLFEEARALEATLPEPSRTLMRAVNQRDVAALGRVLAPFDERVGGNPALSPARSPATSLPVFLLHGSDDNVIPASESLELQRYLTDAGAGRVEMLLSPLLSHAEARPAPRVQDLWRLVSFWTRMWRALER